MPKSTEHHRDDHVSSGHEPRAAASAERKIDVVAQERRQRHVPPSPELGHVRCLVRRVEVLGQAEAEEVAQADSHVAVSRKVEVHLVGEAQDAQPGAQRGELRVPRQCRVDDRADRIGDEDFFDHAEDKE